MRIRSDSFDNGKPIPAEFAMGAPDGFGGNRNPHLAWDGVPAGTRSFALLCIDTDAPTDPSLAGKEGVQVPVEHPRGDFVHWAMADIPADVRGIAAGSCSDGIAKGGKRDPAGPPGARQGLNDYTGWFKGDKDMEGQYLGYDGPCPPWNDERPHHYRFEVHALDLARCPVEGAFTVADVRKAIRGHTLASAAITGVYTLNPAVKVP